MYDMNLYNPKDVQAFYFEGVERYEGNIKGFQSLRRVNTP